MAKEYNHELIMQILQEYMQNDLTWFGYILTMYKCSKSDASYLGLWELFWQQEEDCGSLKTFKNEISPILASCQFLPIQHSPSHDN